ncbi:hypothetical protein Q7P37_001079 [Cladosporium fusiforme]
MAPTIRFNVEDEMIRVRGHAEPEASAIAVHKGLLEKHFPAYDVFLTQPRIGEQLPVDAPRTLELFRLNRRMCVLFVRMLYGQQIWDPQEDLAVDELLVCLAVLQMRCLHELGIEYLSNACLDSIREILIQKTKVPTNPLFNLQPVINSVDDNSIQMIKDILVYSDCAIDGRSVRWVQKWDGSNNPEFLSELCSMFAQKAIPGHLKTIDDLMESCKYHSDESEECPPCGDDE